MNNSLNFNSPRQPSRKPSQDHDRSGKDAAETLEREARLETVLGASRCLGLGFLSLAY